jgi:hypothetical protein
MDQSCGSSCRVPALQAQNPEFKSQFNNNKKKLGALFRERDRKQTVPVMKSQMMVDNALH